MPHFPEINPFLAHFSLDFLSKRQFSYILELTYLEWPLYFINLAYSKVISRLFSTNFGQFSVRIEKLYMINKVNFVTKRVPYFDLGLYFKNCFQSLKKAAIGAKSSPLVTRLIWRKRIRRVFWPYIKNIFEQIKKSKLDNFLRGDRVQAQ